MHWPREYSYIRAGLCSKSLTLTALKHLQCKILHHSPLLCSWHNYKLSKWLIVAQFYLISDILLPKCEVSSWNVWPRHSYPTGYVIVYYFNSLICNCPKPKNYPFNCLTAIHGNRCDGQKTLSGVRRTSNTIFQE